MHVAHAQIHAHTHTLAYIHIATQVLLYRNDVSLATESMPSAALRILPRMNCSNTCVCVCVCVCVCACVSGNCKTRFIMLLLSLFRTATSACLMATNTAYSKCTRTDARTHARVRTHTQTRTRTHACACGNTRTWLYSSVRRQSLMSVVMCDSTPLWSRPPSWLPEGGRGQANYARTHYYY